MRKVLNNITYFISILFVLLNIVFASSNADILVRKLNDIRITATPGRVNDISVIERFCVASNPQGPYSLVAIGSGDNGEFTIQNGISDVPYELSVQDRLSSRTFRPLTARIPLPGLQSRRLVNNRRCRGNPARLQLIIRHTLLEQATAGNYQGSLQLTVIPE